MTPDPSAMPKPVVLVVEDEIVVRMDIVDTLEREGFAVVEAGTADQAIRILENRPDIRIVFTDVNMPGSMDGLKLAAYVRGRWPPIKFIVASGQLKSEPELPEGSRFFNKPYDLTRVVRAMNDLLTA